MAEVVRKRTVQKIASRLAPEELLKYGKALAQCEADLRAEEQDQDSIKQGLKAKLSEIAGRRAFLAGLVSSEEELRDVECEDVFEYSTAKVTRMRLDTGEVVLERPMTGEERQRSLLGDL